MKRLLTGLLLVFYLPINTNGQSNVEPYDFPVKKGTEEWTNLKSSEEKIKACNIPVDLLKQMDSKALAATCLNYPLFIEVLFANNIQQGFSALAKNFNGFQELSVRKDAGEALIGLYLNVHNRHFKESWDDTAKGNYAFEYTFIELLLGQESTITNLDRDEKVRLKNLAINVFDKKNNLIDVFGEFGLNNTAYVLAKILISDGQQHLISKSVSSRELDTYLRTSQFSNKELLHAIYNASKAY